MQIPIDGEPTPAWAVRVPSRSHVLTAYLCDTETQAYVLARKHQRLYDEDVKIEPVTITVVPRTAPCTDG